MKKLIFGLMVGSLIGLNACATTNKSNEQNYPVGEISANTLVNNYQYFALPADYQLTEQELAQVTGWPSELKLDVYFGVWCHDSQREVPRLLKALSANSAVAVRLYGLDIRKQDPQGLAKQQGVKYTPTVVVSLAGVEIGRIVERPQTTLVNDIEKFIQRAAG